jgi:hypothetical protein
MKLCIYTTQPRMSDSKSTTESTTCRQKPLSVKPRVDMIYRESTAPATEKPS